MRGSSAKERVASIVLVGKFLTDFADMVADLAEWADKTVAAWPSRGRRVPAWDVLEEIAARPCPAKPLPGQPP